MNDRTNNTRSNEREGNLTRRQQYDRSVNAKREAARRRAAKKKRGIRIGGFIIRPRLIVALLLIIAVVVVIAVGVSSKEPDCYELNRSSITIFEDARALLIKNERGYSYPDDVTIVSRVQDGTFVNAGDEIAVIRTSNFFTIHLKNSFNN